MLPPTRLDPPEVARAEELAGIGTWSLDLTTGDVVGNPTTRSLLALEPGAPEPTLGDYLRAVHPADRDLLRRHFDRLLSDGEEYDVEHRLLLPDGQLRHMRAVAAVSLDEQGRPCRAYGITQDVTAPRLAAMEVERERNLSRALLASLSEGFVLTSGGTVLEVNRAMCELTGFAAEELVGTTAPYPFWPSGKVDELIDLRTEILDSHGGSGNVVLLRKDGSQFPAYLTATPLRDVDPDGPLWMTTIRDTTEQHAHELELLERAQSDPLTGLLNSRAFREQLRAATAPDQVAAGPVTLALIDIDHFKAINDEHGHAIGDEVLCAVVDRLVAATAGAGTLARVGGEEFALLMSSTNAREAHVVLQRALEALRAEPVGAVGTVTVSAGVAQLFGSMDDNALYRLADAYLYEAKHRGRDQVR